MSHIAIIGAGELGMALAKVLRGKINVRLWDITASRVPGILPLQETVAGADIIFCCVPSFAMREAVSEFVSFIDARATAVVSLAKGIEVWSRKTMDEVLDELIPTSGRWGVMGGPMLANELADGLPCAAEVASRDAATRDRIKALFVGTNLAVETSDDTRGVALAGVLKNIYAVAMGIGAGLGWRKTRIDAFAERAKGEMLVAGLALGAQEKTIRGTAGFADFMATAYSDHSRNRSVGLAFAIDGGPAIKGEGLLSLRPLLEMLGPRVVSFPVLNAIAAVTLRGESVGAVFGSMAG